MYTYSVTSVTKAGSQLVATGFTSDTEVTRHLTDRVNDPVVYDHFIVIRSWLSGPTAVVRTSIKVYDGEGNHVSPGEWESVLGTDF